jgi:tight adherence protein B
MAPQVLVLAAVVGIAVALGLYLAIAPSANSGKDKRVKSIEDYVSGTRAALSGVGGRSAALSATNITEQLKGLGEKVMKEGKSTSRTMELLQRADLPWRAPEWGVLRIVSIVVAPLLGLLFLHGDLFITLLGLGIGVFIGALGPDLVLKFLAGRRSKKFERQMPDILMLVASSLSTGFSLMQSLDACATDAAEPAAKEFSRVMAETRIGVDVEEALDRLAVRMDSDNMAWTAMAIRIQRSVGGNLAETLRQTAATLRERESLRRTVSALSAEGKLSAYVLIALPVGIFFYEMQVNREYIALLWTRPLGLAILGAAAVSMAIGVAWMNTIVKVKV